MRLKKLLPKLKLLKAAFLPYLTYSHLVLHFRCATESRKLEQVQERAQGYLSNMANLCTLRN